MAITLFCLDERWASRGRDFLPYAFDLFPQQARTSHFTSHHSSCCCVTNASSADDTTPACGSCAGVHPADAAVDLHAAAAAVALHAGAAPAGLRAATCALRAAQGHAAGRQPPQVHTHPPTPLPEAL